MNIQWTVLETPMVNFQDILALTFNSVLLAWICVFKIFAQLVFSFQRNIPVKQVHKSSLPQFRSIRCLIRTISLNIGLKVHYQ